MGWVNRKLWLIKFIHVSNAHKSFKWLFSRFMFFMVRNILFSLVFPAMTTLLFHNSHSNLKWMSFVEFDVIQCRIEGSTGGWKCLCGPFPLLITPLQVHYLPICHLQIHTTTDDSSKRSQFVFHRDSKSPSVNLFLFTFFELFWWVVCICSNKHLQSKGVNEVKMDRRFHQDM